MNNSGYAPIFEKLSKAYTKKTSSINLKNSYETIFESENHKDILNTKCLLNNNKTISTKFEEIKPSNIVVNSCIKLKYDSYNNYSTDNPYDYDSKSHASQIDSDYNTPSKNINATKFYNNIIIDSNYYSSNNLNKSCLNIIDNYNSNYDYSNYYSASNEIIEYTKTNNNIELSNYIYNKDINNKSPNELGSNSSKNSLKVKRSYTTKELNNIEFNTLNYKEGRNRNMCRTNRDNIIGIKPSNSSYFNNDNKNLINENLKLNENQINSFNNLCYNNSSSIFNYETTEFDTGFTENIINESSKYCLSNNYSNKDNNNYYKNFYNKLIEEKKNQKN